MRLSFIKYECDESGGPNMPSVYFQFGQEVLVITDSFYGAFAFFDRPSGHLPHTKPTTDFDLSILTASEVAYMWNCFKRKGK